MKIAVTVHPNAKHPKIEKDLLDMLHVYVHEPPLEGRANAAVIKALADFFHVKKNSIVLLHGHKSKHKLFEVREKFVSQI